MEKVITKTSFKPEDHLNAGEIAFWEKKGLKLGIKEPLKNQNDACLRNKHCDILQFLNQPNYAGEVRCDYPRQAVSLSPNRKPDRPLYMKLD